MRARCLAILVSLLFASSAFGKPAKSAPPTLPAFDPKDATLPVSLKDPYRELTLKNRTAEADSTAEARYAIATRLGVTDSLQMGAYLIDYLETRPNLRAGRRPTPRARVESERALRLAQQYPGIDSLFLARALFVQAEIFATSRTFEPADSVHRIALGIRDRHLPADSPMLSFSLGALTTANQYLNRPISLVYGERSLKILEQRSGPDHFRTALARYAFAAALNQFGQVARATVECSRAVPIIRKQLTDDHLEVPRFINAQAILAKGNGDYLEARRLQELELSLIQRRTPPDSIALARYMGLATEIRNDLGDYATALPMAEQTYAMFTSLYPRGDPHIAEAHVQLARAYVGVGDFATGAAWFDSVNAGTRGAHGSTTQSEYAVLLQAQQVRARRDTTTALAWAAGVLAGEDSSHVVPDAYEAEAVRFQLETLVDAGMVRRGLPAYERVLASTTSIYGPSHQSVVRMREALVRALLAARDPRGPNEAREVARQRRADLRALARGFSEQEALFVARRDGLALDPVIVAALARGASAGERTDALAALASSRGLVLEEMARRLREGRVSAAPAVAVAIDSLRLSRRELSRAMLRLESQPGLAPDAGVAVERSHVARWERTLADQLGEQPAADEIATGALAARLESGEVLVSYAHYQTLGAGTPSTRRLAAFVLHANGRAEAFDLADASALERKMSAWRETVSPRGLDPKALAEATTQARVVGDSLRRVVWDPLARSLQGARRVLVVPDGSLQLLDLAVLPAKSKGWLVDAAPLIVRLSSERDLLVPSAAGAGELALAIGDPDFEQSGVALAVATYRGAPSSCRGFADVRFAPLPGARAEADDVAKHWRSAGIDSVLLLEGGDADEARIKLLAPRLRALHVATHGFFMGEGCAGPDEAVRGVGRLTKPAAPKPTAPTAPFFSHRPTELAAREQTLRLAGLALAGANRRAFASATEEDGVLTAEEIATLDLSHTQEVALSACDTGVGDLAVGEGVFGVQRAFQLAGARHMVMSLWSVDDASARAWMQAYYSARLEGRQAPAEAARTAARARLAALRRAGAAEHPSAWAGFIASGR